MVDYIVVGISVIIFIFYLVTMFMSLDIKRSLNKEASTAFVYMMLAITALAIRRVSEIFFEGGFIKGVPYFTDITALIFSILLFMSIFYFHKSIKGLSKKSSTSSRTSKPAGIKVLLSVLGLIILMSILSRFSIINIGVQPDVLSLIAVLFVATEIGIGNMVGTKRKLDKLSWAGIVVLILLFLALALGILGIAVPYIQTAKGILEILLLFFVFFEMIR